LNFIQFHSIDVYAVLILMSIAFIASFVIIIKLCKTRKDLKSKIKTK
jgi:hypothetical protein